MKKLYAPWRSSYTTDTTRGKHDESTPEDCAFCTKFRTQDDAKSYILARFKHHAVLLNLYPYNAGHVLVCPYRHVADYTELTPDETAEFAEFTKRAVRALRRASGAQGFNIGINLGSVAGAGIAAHLHQHVVPRWGGDTNFMPVVGHTRVLPQLLADTRKLLADAWPVA